MRAPAVGQASLQLPEAAKAYGAKLQRAGMVRLSLVAQIEERQRLLATTQLDQQLGHLQVGNIAAGAAGRLQVIAGRKRFLDAPQFYQRAGLVVERGVEAGPAFQRPIEPCQSLFMPVQSPQRGADVVACVGIGRIERLRPLAFGDRLLKPAQADQEDRSHIQGRCMVRPHAVANVEKSERLLQLPGLIVQIAGSARRVPVVRVEVEHLTIGAQGEVGPLQARKERWQGFSSSTHPAGAARPFRKPAMPRRAALDAARQGPARAGRHRASLAWISRQRRAVRDGSSVHSEPEITGYVILALPANAGNGALASPRLPPRGEIHQRLLVGRGIEPENAAAVACTCSVTKSSNAVISKASLAISSARCAGITITPSPSPRMTSPGNTGASPQPIGHVDLDRLVQRQVGRRARPVVIGGKAELCDLGGIAKAAVGDDAGDAALHQPRHQDGAGRRGARILAAVHHQHRAGRAILDRLALRMASGRETPRAC